MTLEELIDLLDRNPPTTLEALQKAIEFISANIAKGFAFSFDDPGVAEALEKYYTAA